MSTQILAVREEALKLLEENLSPNLMDKTLDLVHLQERISKMLVQRSQVMRNLKLFLTPSQYHQVSLILDYTESLSPQYDRITTLENRAIIRYVHTTEIDYTQWLEPDTALELMELQNEEAVAFELEPTWSDEFITEFKSKNNL